MNKAIERINKVLISDKYINPDNILTVIKSDIINIAYNYLDFDKENIITKLEINNNGEYELMFKITAKRLKCVGILPKQF